MNTYQQLNPLATAVAAACAVLIGTLLIGLPMMGFGGYGHMMGSGYPMMGSAGFWFGYGILWWLGSALLFGIAAAIFAWIYNMVNAASSHTIRTTGTPRQTP